MRTKIVRVILMIILGMIVVSCSLFDANEWKEANREATKKDIRCYEKSNGTFYCEDKNGNRTY